MQRRSFLRASALTFTSLLGPAACRDDDLSGAGSTGTIGPGGDDRPVIDAPERFPQSVASGDPRPGSVVVWTRVEDPERPDDDHDVELEIWPLAGPDPDPDSDEGLDSSGGGPSGSGGGPPVVESTVVGVTAQARFDHCVKVKVEGLAPGTEYGYRFAYIRDGTALVSRTGRTKTAPAPDADVSVRFAFASCQDYGGRFFNPYAAMSAEPLDFFVHLGDYIYETVGAAGFQDEGAEGRALVFDDEPGAIELASRDGSSFYAARSLDNYRQLYRAARSDAALQSVHERIAMIAVWDDHEFANDHWGATATHFGGRRDESDPSHRAAANQAWFEYMPVDYPQPDFTYDPAVAPPEDIRIYRDFEFGRHLHLVMTDLRSYRPDHLIPEDAYPGAVPMDEAALASVRPDTSVGVPYVDIEAFSDGVYAPLLRAVAEANDYDPARVIGNVSAPYINRVIEAEGSDLPPISEPQMETLPRGLAFHQMFKNGFYGQIGSRYLVAHDPFSWYAAWRNAQTDGAAQRVMGAAQEQWFLERMRGSTHTWKVWGNEFCLTGLNIDLRGSSLPPAFREAFVMNCDDWNGFPDSRAQLVDALAEVDNVVAITGDLHAFLAGTPFSRAGTTDGHRLVEFVTSSISTRTYSSILVSQVREDPNLSEVNGIEAFALGIRDLLLGGVNPNLGFAVTDQNGFSVVTVEAAQLRVDHHMVPEVLVTTNLYDDPSLAGEITIERFRVDAGSRDLYRDIDGAWRRWDPPTRAWV